MADYHPLIARAIAGLEINTGEARRALYERARAALLAQLRATTPALTESDITRERLALEEAIRKIEAEEARRGRRERPPVASMPPGQAEASPPSSDAVAAASPDPNETPPVPNAAPASPVMPETPRLNAADWRRSSAEDRFSEADRPPAPLPLRPEPVVEEQPPAKPTDNTEAARLDAALRKLRDRLTTGESDVVPQWPRVPPREENGEHERGRVDMAFDRRPLASEPSVDATAAEPDVIPLTRDVASSYGEHRPRRRWSGTVIKVVIAVIVIAVLGALVAAGYRERGSLVALYRMFQGSPAPVTREEVRTQPKIEDRVGSSQPDRLPGSLQRGSTGPSTQMPAVAQRVVLYEEDPADAAGKRFVGSVIWRTETVSPGPGLAPELAVKANIEIPERHVTMTFSMVRNTDTKLPASHTIDIRFNLPPGFPGGGVANVPGILMKQAEQTRGVPLAGIAVKVTNNVFLIGLSSVDSDLQRNTQLLKERTWFDVPIVYSSGSRAILAVEKGTPGERAFNDAFTAWGRTGAAAR